jgi:hypothetical protein
MGGYLGTHGRLGALYWHGKERGAFARNATVCAKG